MNLNLGAKRILCFGDSNTWGASPETDDRFPLNERWTGILQEVLGYDYEIIEEGYGGRTTDIDDPSDKFRNGYNYFVPCLYSHLPLDVVVIALGTNDLKNKFNRSPLEIAYGIERLLEAIKPACQEYELEVPKVIILSPAYVDDATIKFDALEGTEEKSKQLAEFYKEVANRMRCEIIDLAEYISSSKKDGVHLDREAHRRIAEVLSKKIRELNK